MIYRIFTDNELGTTVEPRPPRNEMINDIHRLHRAGHSVDAIASMLERSPQTIRRWLRLVPREVR